MEQAPVPPDAEREAKLQRTRTEYNWAFSLGMVIFMLGEATIRWHAVKVGIYIASVAAGVTLFGFYRFFQLRKLEPDPGKAKSWLTILCLVFVLIEYAGKVVSAIFK